MLVLEAERKQGSESKEKDFALTPRARKKKGRGGGVVLCLLALGSKIGHYRKYFSMHGPLLVSHTAPSPLQ